MLCILLVLPAVVYQFFTLKRKVEERKMGGNPSNHLPKED